MSISLQTPHYLNFNTSAILCSMLSLILDRLSYLDPFTGSSISLIMQKVRVSVQTEDFKTDRRKDEEKFEIHTFLEIKKNVHFLGG